MAATEAVPAAGAMSITSYDTALCIIPPHELCGNIDQLRQIYDKAYESWPAHINIIYPFVAPDHLPRAQQQLQAQVVTHLNTNESSTITLGEAGFFTHRNNSTIFLKESVEPALSIVAKLRMVALRALGHDLTPSNLHLTIGQSEDNSLSSREYLLAKARLIPAIEFKIGALAILIRERGTGPNANQQMKLWGIVDIGRSKDAWKPSMPEYWIKSSGKRPCDVEDHEERALSLTEPATFIREVQPGTTFHYDSTQNIWSASTGNSQVNENLVAMTVASYNVLIDSEYPPARERDPLVVQTILAGSALSDILVLQEVSDDFLSYMLEYSEVRERYPFTSHGPPTQSNIGPLPSLRNIVVLSRWPFRWNFVPFHRKHKGAVVARFAGVAGMASFVVAGVHLTCGLTDGSVATKKVQLDNLTSYLKRHHSSEPWIITGDFNLTTSTYTINTALKDKSISSQTVETLSSIEGEFVDLGLLDAWAVARIEATDETSDIMYDDLFEGEEGATFNPRDNVLAAATSGTSNNRPQRYDRLLVRPKDGLRVARFNQFGLPENIDGVQVVPSDHAGIRSTLKVIHDTVESGSVQPELMLQRLVEYKRASKGLSQSSKLTSTLDAFDMFPTDNDSQLRQRAFALLKQVVLGDNNEEAAAPSDIPMKVVTVGSYALGVWTSESDIDCLCIGTISSKTFFKLVRQRLLKAEAEGIRILRKVEASTGTMLELSVNGIPIDLQYCPAARVVERWSDFRQLQTSDPTFNLSILSLRKLKPYRDLVYIQRTLPSMSTFQLAYRCIKLWATERGIYAAKFGYLGGVHITLMLCWVYKRLAHDNGAISAADLVLSFFHYYAKFDWANDMVYDAFFHNKKPKYHRSAREPMVILGYHTPNSNIAHTSTAPSLQVMVDQFKAADACLSSSDMTWEDFLGLNDSQLSKVRMGHGTTDFLSSYETYVKIDIQFWGRTLAKGKGLVGWVESRCLSLIVDIHKSLPNLGARIWPSRFTDGDSEEGQDYHGCYLIGLSNIPGATGHSNITDEKLTEQFLGKMFDRFLSQLRTDEKYYDPGTCWIGCSLAKSHELTEYRLDQSEWGDYVADVEPDSDDEEDMVDDSGDLTSRVQRTIPQRPKPTSTPLSTAKLRPASDVLNRLRWDPNLDPADYIIGYEDRFLGAKETSLEKWKTEQTDEEFIPQHRILYFKKKGGDDGKGDLVWERATRIDKVFGSGASAGRVRDDVAST